MRPFKMITQLSSAAALLVLGLTPVTALAAGPGTSSSNLTTVTTGYASDATGSAEAQSNEQFTVAPGALTLNSVPNILLSSTGVQNIATADTTLNVNNGNTNGGEAYDGNGSGKLDVSDYRGNHAGWTLTVGMGPFTSGPATVNSATLNLTTNKGTVDNTATAAPTALSLTPSTLTTGWVTSPQTIWAAPVNTGEGDNSATTATSSSLVVGKQPTISSGTYSATLYWALQDAPTAAPATTQP